MGDTDEKGPVRVCKRAGPRAGGISCPAVCVEVALKGSHTDMPCVQKARGRRGSGCSQFGIRSSPRKINNQNPQNTKKPCDMPGFPTSHKQTCSYTRNGKEERIL